MNRLSSVLVFVLLFSPQTVPGQEHNVLEDHWYIVTAKSRKLGYSRDLTESVERDGQNLIRTTVYNMTKTKEQDEEEYVLEFMNWMLETAAGQVKELGYQLSLSDKQKLEIRGVVSGHRLKLTVYDKDGQDTGFGTVVDWDPEISGDHHMKTVLANFRSSDKAINSKDFDYRLHRTRHATYRTEGMENVDVSGRQLLLNRIEMTYRPNDFTNPSTLWVNDEGTVIKERHVSMVLGELTYELCDKATALKDFTAEVEEIPEPIYLDKPIPAKPRPKELVLEISVAAESDHRSLFPESPRQMILSSNESSVTLKLLPYRAVGNQAESKEVDQEFLTSNFFIRSDDPEVRRIAREITDEDASIRRKCAQISRWVDQHVNASHEIGNATADEVLRLRRGDCSELSILAAALCRAEGIPSRIAMGLIIEDKEFYAHQWAEVNDNGTWQPLDPTGEIRRAKAAYIKVLHSSMKNVIDPDGFVELDKVWSRRVDVRVLEIK